MKAKGLEDHFLSFQQNIIGHKAKYMSPYGEQEIIYADWIASGRLYLPIEKKIIHDIGPFIANKAFKSK